MKKFKVYLASGITQTILADSFIVKMDGFLYITINDKIIATFPTGGWQGVQDLEAYKKVEVEV